MSGLDHVTARNAWQRRPKGQVWRLHGRMDQPRDGHTSLGHQFLHEGLRLEDRQSRALRNHPGLHVCKPPTRTLEAPHLLGKVGRRHHQEPPVADSPRGLSKAAFIVLQPSLILFIDRLRDHVVCKQLGAHFAQGCCGHDRLKVRGVHRTRLLLSHASEIHRAILRQQGEHGLRHQPVGQIPGCVVPELLQSWQILMRQDARWCLCGDRTVRRDEVDADDWACWANMPHIDTIAQLRQSIQRDLHQPTGVHLVHVQTFERVLSTLLCKIPLQSEKGTRGFQRHQNVQRSTNSIEVVFLVPILCPEAQETEPRYPDLVRFQKKLGQSAAQVLHRLSAANTERQQVGSGVGEWREGVVQWKADLPPIIVSKGE
mmetsp:Transcript_165544/g.531250  ORF Transcript_165544/g.531250 Transcript_165544/m.531250 type:complete len:371 (+) Transcript_165544:777-1889(+)